MPDWRTKFIKSQRGLVGSFLFLRILVGIMPLGLVSLLVFNSLFVDLISPSVVADADIVLGLAFYLFFLQWY